MSIKETQQTVQKPRKGGGEKPQVSRDSLHGWYLACLGAAADLKPLAANLQVEGMSTDKCQTVDAAGIAAIVSRVPLSEYGEDQLSANLGKLEWLADRAARHERIVQTFAAQASVVPLRFGTIFLSQDSVEAFIRDNQASISAMIDRLRGKEEWGLEVHVNRETLLAAVEKRSSSVRELGERVARAAPGQAYLLGKSLESLKQQAARDEVRRLLDAIASRMPYHSVDLGLPKFGADRKELAGRFAFLVDRDQFETFRCLTENLAADFQALGLTIELAGPLPPYSFVDRLEADAG